MENNENFSFTYSPQQQKEVEEIRKKYLPQEETQMDRLRRLHAVPTRKARTAAITAGVFGMLIMGTGMSLAMTDIGAVLGNLAIAFGIIVGVAGMVLAALAYPLYKRVLKKQRAIIAPEILRLSNELLK